MFSGKRIILGVTGGIAAYKSVYLLRQLQRSGAEVRVVMTRSATRFVGSATFASLTPDPVAVDIFPEQGSSDEAWTRHIDWAEWADLFIVAPCTANTLAKIAHGQADNMLTATVLAARCPLLICPTMDGEMYQAPATRQNLKLVRDFGYHILDPEEGYLASGIEGRGRLPEVEKIIEKAQEILNSSLSDSQPLKNRKVLVTAGPTREYIDAVRFISNPSSGKMGCAMAAAAQKLGGDVNLVHGPVSEAIPEGVSSHPVTSADEMFEKVTDFADADLVIMAAAVSDFKPKSKSLHKVKKKDGEHNLPLTRTSDILEWLGQQKANGQTLIGFAMETENLIDNARDKKNKKNLDWIIANSIDEPGSGFAHDTNHVYLIGSGEPIEMKGTKKELAQQILKEIFTP